MTEYAGSYKFRKVFSIMTLADVNDGGTPYMGISPQKEHARARIDRSESPAINVLLSRWSSMQNTRSRERGWI